MTLTLYIFLNIPLTWIHCVKYVRIRSFSVPYFPAFGPEKLQIVCSYWCVSLDGSDFAATNGPKNYFYFRIFHSKFACRSVTV